MIIFTLWDIGGYVVLGVCTVILVGAVIALKAGMFLEERERNKAERKRKRDEAYEQQKEGKLK